MLNKVSAFIFISVVMFLFSIPSHATVFKIATLSPDGSSWMKKMRQGANEIATLTDNRVKFKFYPGGIMGDDQAVIRKIRIRQLQGGAVTAGSVGRFFPDNQIYSQALIFKSLDEVSYVRKYLDELIIKGLDNAGFVTFGLAEGGFAYIMSMNPIRSVDDLRKQKAWIPSADEAALEAIKAFSVTPIPLPLGDVLAGLQTGLIDAVAAPPIVALALHWHTQVKYLTELPVLYSYAQLIIDKHAFNKLSNKDKTIVHQVMGKVFKEIDAQNRRDNLRALEALRNQGIKFIKPSAKDIRQWQEYASSSVERLVKSGRISQSMMNKLTTYLTTFRSNTHDPKQHTAQ